MRLSVSASLRLLRPWTVCTTLLCTVALARSGAPASQEPGGPSLDSIAGAEWVLEKWDREETAPAAPPVTLSYEDGRFIGNGGCNRYFAPVTPGSEPGDITVGAVGATRMFCPDPASAIEARFLKQLAAVQKYEFSSGKLALVYEVDGKRGVMLFEKKEAK